MIKPRRRSISGSATGADASDLAGLPVVQELERALDVLRDSIPGFIRRAFIDGKTQLFNSDALEEVVQNQFLDGRFWVVFLDLTGFKSVNDTLGHDAGDAALLAVAGALRRITRGKQAVPFRVGGDEFLIVARPRAFRDLRPALCRLHWREFTFEDRRSAFTSAKGAARGGRGLSFIDVRTRADEACRISKERNDELVIWSPRLRAQLPKKIRFRCKACRAVTEIMIPAGSLGTGTSYACGNCRTDGQDKVGPL